MDRIFEAGAHVMWAGRTFEVLHMPRKGAVALRVEGRIQWVDVREVVAL